MRFNGWMAEEQTVQLKAETPWWKTNVGSFVLVWGAIALVAVAVFVVVQVRAQNAHDQRVDEYYCAQEGIGAFDRAPNSGERCIDL